ncbi:Lsr2 dimerization domain-containing protein, partial [Microbacterium trichothecenolyticum]|uniref:Nucleoid-associated protein Lsr2 n=1 Tax=Microbacterium trichothecenolyticum TaxID=69370 RepID=A0A0M2HM91_MICTR
MSRTTRVILVDDIDGSEDDVREVAFSLDGKSYAIDLSAANRTDLEAALQPYVGAARKVGRKRAKR